MTPKRLTNGIDVSTPVLVLGGAASALSLVRSIGRVGGKVSVCARHEGVFHSKYVDRVHRVARHVDPKEVYADLLLGSSDQYRGYVVLAAGDAAVEFLARHRDELERDYLLERNDPAIQLAMLDKRKTLELAESVGVNTPKYWPVDSMDSIPPILAEIEFPAIVKPNVTFEFRRRFSGFSYVLVHDEHELTETASKLFGSGLEFTVCEKVAGPDDLLCSCYAYITEDGTELFILSKRIIRRSPLNTGAGTFQITKRQPDVEEAGMRFLRGIGYRGFGNVEFKRDPHDGRLKIIECNARFTAVQEELTQAGVDASLITYCHITRQDIPTIQPCRDAVAIWRPRADFRAFREGRAVTGASYFEWLWSLRCKKLVFPYFAWDDLQPALRLFFSRKKRLTARFANHQALDAPKGKN